MGLVIWIVGGIVAALGTIAVKLISDEVSGRAPLFAKWIIEQAASRLPDPMRSRYQGYWLQDLEGRTGTLSKLSYAIRCFRSVRRLIRLTGLKHNRMGVIAEVGELPDGTPGIAGFSLPNLELSNFSKGVVTYDARQFGPILVEDVEKHRSEIEELWGCPVIIEVPEIGGMLLEGTVRIRPKSPHLFKLRPHSEEPHGFWSNVRFACHMYITIIWDILARPLRALRSEADLSAGRTLYVEPKSSLGEALITQQKIAALPSLGKQWNPPRPTPQLVIMYESELLCVWNGDESELQSLDEKMLKSAEHAEVSVDVFASSAIIHLPEFRKMDDAPALGHMGMCAAVWWVLQHDTHDADYPGRVRDHVMKENFYARLVVDKPLRAVLVGVKARRSHSPQVS
jgi:hypothetical protein